MADLVGLFLLCHVMLAEDTKVCLFGCLWLGAWLRQHIQDGFSHTHGTSSVVSVMTGGWLALFLFYHSVILPQFLYFWLDPKRVKWSCQALELTQHHFFLILLVKTSHRASNNSREEKYLHLLMKGVERIVGGHLLTG